MLNDSTTRSESERRSCVRMASSVERGSIAPAWPARNSVTRAGRSGGGRSARRVGRVDGAELGVGEPRGGDADGRRAAGGRLRRRGGGGRGGGARPGPATARPRRRPLR